MNKYLRNLFHCDHFMMNVWEQIEWNKKKKITNKKKREEDVKLQSCV